MDRTGDLLFTLDHALSAIKKGGEIMASLIQGTQSEQLEHLNRDLLRSFVETLDEDRSAVLLVTLLPIPCFGELLYQHLRNALTHPECLAVPKGGFTPTSPFDNEALADQIASRVVKKLHGTVKR